MGKILKFKSCAQNGEFTSLGVETPSTVYYIGVNTPSNIDSYIASCYASDANLAGKVNGIGYGWQKYVVPSTGKLKFSVRGAAGGATGRAGYTIDPVTGDVVGTGNRPGRGAKIEGTCVLTKGSILYILVGMRGWCNNGDDWAGGGGGASVILLDNESGAYTFAPLNRKVDVLFVAGGGGGCYDVSFGNKYYGYDADYNDGTNTNGGAGGRPGGGAGLTGNGGGGYTAYNLLSGNPASTTLNTYAYGGRGGGGHSYNGGGGGGGYSGGNATIHGGGAYGGTSYINPTLCTETFRGYATVAEDSGRNLTNPWTAYGFVEIELGRDESKFILAKDSDGYKWFNGITNLDDTTNSSATNKWELLSNQNVPTQDIYDAYGDKVITSADGLQNNVRFLVSAIVQDEELDIVGQVSKTVVEMTKDCNTSDVDTISNISFTGDLTNVDVRFAVSKDSGTTWQTYRSGVWKDIDITDKDDFLTNGYSLNNFTSIPKGDIKAYLSKKIRFAFIIDQTGDKTATLIKSIKITVDLVGSWKHAKESQVEYEYVSDTDLKVTFLEDGDYKVNYLDKIVTSS